MKNIIILFFTITLSFIFINSCTKYENKEFGNIISCDTCIAPIAMFKADTTQTISGDSIKFTDQSTNTPTSWLWNFGDGNTSELQNPIHKYDTAGLYNVLLKVTNKFGTDTAKKEDYIYIGNIPNAGYPPVANFTANQIDIIVGDTINFTDQSTNSPTSWYWIFGDGSTSTLQNPSHVYSTGGSYTVKLQTTNSFGMSNIETKYNYIIVNFHNCGTVTDYDGNVYNTVTIGSQCWMAENLKATHYPNGDAIPLVTDNTAWGNLANDNTSDAYSYYDNSSTNATTYGALYTYAAAIGDNWTRDNTANQGVCPDGWHLPTDTEWDELETYLGTNAGSKLAGNATLWQDGSLDQSADFGTSGFSALPSGGRGSSGGFDHLGSHGSWRSATESNSIYAYYRYLLYDYAGVYRFNPYKSDGCAVRCVRD